MVARQEALPAQHCFILPYELSTVVSDANAELNMLGIDTWQYIYTVLQEIRSGCNGIEYRKFICELEADLVADSCNYHPYESEYIIATWYFSNQDAIRAVMYRIWHLIEAELQGYRNTDLCTHPTLNIVGVDIDGNSTVVYVHYGVPLIENHSTTHGRARPSPEPRRGRSATFPYVGRV